MQEMTRYEPGSVEKKWYKYWEEQGYFRSIPDEKEPFTILMPPPNVTGVLHMGHMLNITIQDILIRKARLSGKNACWVPGLDHASIATEAKVVKQLREKGIKKSDLTREEFLQHAWNWKEEYGGKILEQLKKLGASCDWQRTKFTMDPEMSKAVIFVFNDLFEKGLLYRDWRMTNWDPSARTVLSNEEVIHSEENSQLYYLKYQVENSDEYLTIATTRPETILGDTAVAVHPEDERYLQFHGKNVIIPVVNRTIPIITDEYVDMEFGTGALKITPAHDTNDYEIGKKHQLESIDIFNENATIKEGYGSYSGLDRFELRKLIAKDLADKEFLVKKENYRNKVGRSERTNSIIEPRLTLQWFVKMENLAKDALEAVKDGTIGFFPPHFINMYENWLTEKNVRDWCISRQLWWGHQIPAWYIGEDVFVAIDESEALEKAKQKLGDHITKEDLKRDEDVLDTWFSSWLWPISVFHGFDDQKELEYYYPTDVLVTAWDIIFFWVARMVMAGNTWSSELLGGKTLPSFKHVYFTGMVRDKQRRKMSKSLGNSPDALELLNKYGADGVRFGMLSSAAAGNDIIFDAPLDPKTGEATNESKLCEQGANFANKLWQALRLIKNWPVLDENSERKSSDIVSVRWINSKFNAHIKEIEQSYSQYRLSEVVIKQYNFIWNDFCSWYLEAIKPEYQGSIHPKTLEETVDMFEQILISLHPLMPFVSEEIWHHLRKRDAGDDLIVQSFPDSKSFDGEIIEKMETVQQLVTKIRELRQQYQIKKSTPLSLAVAMPEILQNWESEEGLLSVIQKMGVLGDVLSNKDNLGSPVEFISGVNKFYIEIPNEIDWEEEKKKTMEEIEYYEGFLISVDKKLSNQRFVDNAPAVVVDKERKKKADAEMKLENLRSTLENINSNL